MSENKKIGNGFIDLRKDVPCEFTEIVISYYIDSFNKFNQITLIKDNIIEYCGPFEIKYHAEYLNLDITKFEEIKK